MNRTESIRAAQSLANDWGIRDEQCVETLATDETFAAYAYLFQQAQLYSGLLEAEGALEEMRGDAHDAVHSLRLVSKARACELLGVDDLYEAE
ncbi:uncharacterized protein HfgLR_25200 (plasmid) [Haloferax gibbonsii]|uniref:Uncharacterized protein n=1 Tax=Haloferax gibbonsii TaxID=35746 RepID=A0A871BM84_HALGI|nr:hypothetical protein [Haloferax gibbonsii]QOS14118.1 uncharacterized protein HfgLR_25200 [Haloferax gibbonsii]